MSKPKHRIPIYTKEEIERQKAAALEMLFQDALKRPLLHPQPKPDNVAPEGRIWICAACGKTAKDKFNGKGEWDESCMLNAVLITEEELKEIERKKKEQSPSSAETVLSDLPPQGRRNCRRP